MRRSAPREEAPAVVAAAVAPAPAAYIPHEVHSLNAYLEGGAPEAMPAPRTVRPVPSVPRGARSIASFFMVALAAIAVGTAIIRAVDAASFVGPTAAPPGGNVPITVWNREASGTQQVNASIDIDGGSAAATGKGLSVGKNTLDLGSGAGGQNVFYGVSSYAGMHAGDSLLKLQTAVGAVYTDRLTVSKNGDLLASGNAGIGGISPAARLHVADLTSNNNPFQHLQYLTGNSNTESAGEAYDATRPSVGLAFRRQWNSGTFTNLAGIYGFGSSGWRGGLLFRTKNNTTSTGEPDVNAMMISPAGRVGIGTLTPAEELTVVGNGTGAVRTQVQNTSTAAGSYAEFNVVGDVSNAKFGVGAGANTGLTAAGNVYLGTDNNVNLVQYTSGAERLRITGGGNIGINQSNPLARLSFGNNVGSGFIDNFSEYQMTLWNDANAATSFGIGITPYTMVFNSGGGAYSFDRAGAATTLSMTTSGRVGVNTTAPARQFEVNTAGIWPARFIGTHDTATAVEIRNEPANTTWELAVSNTYIGAGKFYLFSGGPRFSIDTTGRVGMGRRVDTVGYPLDIASNTGTAITRISDDSAAGNLWTGLRLDRGYGAERWFWGMGSADNSMRLRRGGTSDVMVVQQDGTVTFNNSFTISPSGAVSGLSCSGASVVGITPGAVNGDPTGPGGEQGYAAVNALCNAAFAGAHACSSEEILSSISCGKTSAWPAAGDYWVVGGAPGYTSSSVNDCNGFNINTSASGSYGRRWTFPASPSATSSFGYGQAMTCSSSLRVTCCR